MEVIIFSLLFLVLIATTIFMFVAPPGVAVLGYYFLRKKGLSVGRAIFLSVTPVLGLVAWPLSGVVDLNDQCGSKAVILTSSEKLELKPIDALLIEGPGMWWLEGKIDIERPEYGRPNFFRRKESSIVGKSVVVLRQFRKLSCEAAIR